jgi:hypothetical protein
MWGIFAGITAFIVVYQMIEQWRLRRADKRRLTEMRKHSRWGTVGMPCGGGGQMIDVRPSAGL